MKSVPLTWNSYTYHRQSYSYSSLWGSTPRFGDQNFKSATKRACFVADSPPCLALQHKTGRFCAKSPPFPAPQHKTGRFCAEPRLFKAP